MNRHTLGGCSCVQLEWEVEALREALLWCGGSPSFAPGGEAYSGWVREVVPLLERKVTFPSSAALTTRRAARLWFDSDFQVGVERALWDTVFLTGCKAGRPASDAALLADDYLRERRVRYSLKGNEQPDMGE